MPAPASLSIAAVAQQVGEVELPDPIVLAPRLAQVLAEVVDPRKPRGVRHGLVVVLTAAVCAVAAGRGRSLRSPSESRTCPTRRLSLWILIVDARRSQRSAG